MSRSRPGGGPRTTCCRPTFARREQDGTCGQQPPNLVRSGPFGQTTAFDLSGFVTLQSGAYLFAPRFSLLKGLK
jgi:hypothetical protein